VLCTVPRLINPRQKRMQRLNLALTAFTVAISFATFSVFVVLTLKGVDRTLAFVKRFVDF